MACTDSAPNAAAARVAATTQRRLSRRPPSLGRSRMAAMMLILEMRMLVNATVTNAIRNPIAKPLTRLIGVTWKARSSPPPSSAEKLWKIWAATTTTARPPPPPHADPDQDAEQAGDQRVDGALDDEAADQPAAFHADRPEHAQLGFPPLGQHHEDVHQQPPPGDDREAADEQEQRPQAV